MSARCDGLVYHQKFHKFQDMMKDHIICFLYQLPKKILPWLYTCNLLSQLVKSKWSCTGTHLKLVLVL